MINSFSAHCSRHFVLGRFRANPTYGSATATHNYAVVLESSSSEVQRSFIQLIMPARVKARRSGLLVQLVLLVWILKLQQKFICFEGSIDPLFIDSRPALLELIDSYLPTLYFAHFPQPTSFFFCATHYSYLPSSTHRW